MFLLGLLSAAGLGLMALRGVAYWLVPGAEEPFLLPLGFAIPVALLAGAAVTYFTGRLLGLFRLRDLHDYEVRRRDRAEILTPPADRPAVLESPIEY